MTGKGLTWTAAHLKAAATPEDVRTAIAEATAQLGDASIPASTVLALLEELALDAVKMRSELRAATRVREALLASVAHDLRNPLNTFAMSAGLLRDDLEGPELDRTRALSLLARMDRASVRMQALIEDLLEASRIEAGAVELNRKPEDAGAIARAAIEKARPAVAEKGATLDEGAIADDATVELDKARTVDALTKLVLVTLKTTGEGGMIRLGVERADEKVVFTLRSSPARASASATAHDESRGGLAFLIARGLVVAQGGQLGTELTPEGPRTLVTFPARR